MNFFAARNEPTMTQERETFFAGMAKLLGIGGAAGGAWALQDTAQLVAICSGLVAIISGLIYSVKMVLEIYWLNRIKSREAERLEGDHHA